METKWKSLSLDPIWLSFHEWQNIPVALSQLFAPLCWASPGDYFLPNDYAVNRGKVYPFQTKAFGSQFTAFSVPAMHIWKPTVLDGRSTICHKYRLWCHCLERRVSREFPAMWFILQARVRNKVICVKSLTLKVCL